MYTAFYGLREKPFALSPDPRFLYLAQSHREALAHLLYGIEQGEGFICITGEVGTGKTTLCRALLRRLGPEVEVAFLFNPKLSARELLEAVHVELGLEPTGDSPRELVETLNRFLLEKRAEGRRVLLIIDEAQGLPQETLEQIRLLSNLETEREKLIQILLLGQPELDAMLESPSLRQLRQRIGVRWRLAPLSGRETREYVRHRLRVAAGEDRELLTEGALREVHRRSGGIPRRINLLCDRALLAGYAEGLPQVGPGLVRRADRELRGGGSRWRLPRPARRVWLPAAAALAVLAVAAVAWRWQAGGGMPAAGATANVAAAGEVRSGGGAGLAGAGAVEGAPAAPTARSRDAGGTVAQRAGAGPAGAANAEQTPSTAAHRAQPEPPGTDTAGGAGDASLSRDDAAARSVTAGGAGADAAASTAGTAGPQSERGAASGAGAAAGAAPGPEGVTQVASVSPPPVPTASLDSAEALRLALAEVPPGAATSASLASVLEAWGVEAPAELTRRPMPFARALGELSARGLSILTLPRTRLAVLEGIDHPALLRVEAADGVPRTVALLGVDGERVRIAGPRGPVPVEAPREALASAWRGEAYVVWRDFAEVPELLARGARGPAVRWLQSALAELGLLEGPVTGVYDEATVRAVVALQRVHGIAADGVVGPVTKMALYASLPSYAVPRLRAAPQSSPERVG